MGGKSLKEKTLRNVGSCLSPAQGTDFDSHYFKCGPWTSNVCISYEVISNAVSAFTPDLLTQSLHFNKTRS